MTSRTAERLRRHVERLGEDRHYRDTQREFMIEGPRALIAASRHIAIFSGLVVSSPLLKCAVARSLSRQLQSDGLETVFVSPDRFRRISTAVRASGIVAVVQQRHDRLENVTPSADRCWLAVSRIRSAGNLGTLMRSAVAASADGLVLIGQSTDPYQPDVIRSSMGSLFSLRIARASWESFRSWTKAADFTVVGACPSGKQSFWDASLPRRTVFMLGEERAGLSSRQRKACDRLVRIPMAADADSLNVGVAGSLLLHEYRRQQFR